MNPNGRDSLYKPEYNRQAYKLCLLGYTDAELADFFEICEATLNNWKKEYPEFLESITSAKENADANVVESLYKRATGYDCKAIKFATFEGQITDSEEYIEHHPPDPQSIKYWLNNRQKKRWRETKDVTVIVDKKLEDMINE